jgi:hypothetical protein
MQNILKAILVAPLAGLVLSGCTDLTALFAEGDPAEVSSCEYLLSNGLDELLCVECDSGDNEQNSTEECGVEITARCNSKMANDVYGVALGNFVVDTETFSFLTATAWYDSDDDGADDDDMILCHEQSGGLLEGKQEWKCTTELTGNGKNDTTFEVEVKYDDSKNDCI